MIPQQPATYSRGGRYRQILRRSWPVVAIGVLVGLLVAAAYLALTPRTTTAQVKVNLNVVSLSPFEQDQPAGDLVDPATEAGLVAASPVVDAVAELVDRPAAEVREHMSAEMVEDTTVMEITYGAESREDAVAGADALAANYLEHRQATAEERLAGVQERLTERETEVRQQLADALAEERAEGASAVARARAEASRTALRTQLRTVVEQGYAMDSIDTGGGEVLTAAEDNPTTTAPNRPLALGIGLLAGLLLGLVAGFGRNAVSATVRDGHEVGRVTGHPVLATLTGTAASVPAEDADRDTYRSIRERILTLPERRHLISIADIAPAEGQPTDVAVNVALATAEAGIKTELVIPPHGAMFSTLRPALGLKRRPLNTDAVARYDSTFFPELVVTIPGPEDGRSNPWSAYLTLRAEKVDGDDTQLVILGFPAYMGRSYLLAAARMGDQVVLTATLGEAEKDELAQVARDVAAVDGNVLGTVLCAHPRRWLDDDED
ncbi:hypothetical protein KUV85_08735 [Nocardioides panacisoli]|uniref:hypothetical protein n=1 Tax=Nocardioides panacisoli TaxID=627624 RepID=UPI001C6325BE|nr:hypothetical protein [Nocardioides panacisoli]QYJ05749.1 hypothetical protein KUV85_08735 [Nocardioides panacisoli]